MVLENGFQKIFGDKLFGDDSRPILSILTSTILGIDRSVGTVKRQLNRLRKKTAGRGIA